MQSLPARARAWTEPYLIVGVSVLVAVAGVRVLGGQTTVLAAAAALAAVVMLTQLTLKTALFLLLPTIVLWVRLGTPARPLLPAPTDLLFLGLAALLLVQAWRRREPIEWMATDLFFAGFLLCAFLSLPLTARPTSFLFSLKIEMLAYIAFRVVVVLLADRRDVTRVFTSLLVVQAAMLVMFFWSYANTYQQGGAMAVVFDRGSTGQAGGVGAPWAYANGFAAHVALLLPVVAALATLAPPRARQIAAISVALLSVGALLMSASRGATLAAVIGGAAFVWAHRHRPLLVLGMVAAALACAAVLALTNPAMEFTVDRFTKLGDDESSEARIAVWRTYAEAILERPLLGHGLDNTGLSFSTERTRGHLDAHNFLLKAAYQTGFLGLAFRIALLGCFGLVLWRARHRGRSDPAIYAAFVAIFLTALSNGMVENVFSGERYNLLFMLLMGLLLVWARAPQGPAGVGQPEPATR